jgi:ribonuclease Z
MNPAREQAGGYADLSRQGASGGAPSSLDLGAVEVTFLGTGAAFSPNGYNASILVDRTILLDAGAPLCVHLPHVGVEIAEPRAALLSHFHADHTFGLATFLLGRALMEQHGPAFTIYGPAGTADYIRGLLDFAWGEEMRYLTFHRLQLTVRDLAPGEAFTIDGAQGRAFQMTHSARFSCLGYLLERDGVRLGYTGDAASSTGLQQLIQASDHVIAEMTYDDPGEMHLSRREILDLMRSYPKVRFLLTHRGTDRSVDGAVLAHDFLTVQLPLR